MQSRSLYQVLAAARSGGSPALMVDVKCRSPRDGELISSERLEPYVCALVGGGVDALSTPTDPVYFDGSIETAKKIRELSPVPLMRKEFFDDVDQMDESVEAGFDAVQLSLSTFVDRALFLAMKARAEQLGLEVVIAVQSVQQLELAVEYGAIAISINCRGVAALRLEGRAASYGQVLASMAPQDVLVLLECAVSCRGDIEGAAKAGADGVLMGTTIAKSSDPVEMLRSLRPAAPAWRASA
ncbi:MAG: indole-3-glycerol phosphate synthase [Pseudonocardiales bacterium]|nr:indole-3-glycerol phosphate synthase [Pseudonocardiales bacterium]